MSVGVDASGKPFIFFFRPGPPTPFIIDLHPPVSAIFVAPISHTLGDDDPVDGS